MRRPTALLTTLAFLALLPAGATPLRHDNSGKAPPRRFEFTYQVRVPPMKGAPGKLLLWLPLPGVDGYQTVDDLNIESVASYSEGKEPEYGNRYVVFHPTAAQSEAGFDATIRFWVTRSEHKVALPAGTTVAANAGGDPGLERYLEPDKMVPLNGVIADLAKEHTTGDTMDVEKARHIYEYVVATMRYDKTGEGWGRGDAIWACTSKRGNCTDFHSLFIGMMRASNIPARFEIGFPIPPEGKTEGGIPGYHCWAEFYLNGTGWVPVDASEAWKNPAKHDYFFGAHDTNRVFFTYGRDIRLSPEQKGAPLNYFIYPYAELDGKAVSGLETHFSFREAVAPAVPVAH